MITGKELRTRLHYDPVTGVFTWLKSDVPARWNGLEAGSRLSNGYVYIAIENKKLLAHRLAFVYMEGHCPEDMDVDHINGDPSDNRWLNLRLVTTSTNLQNLKRPHVDNVSGLLGVSPIGKKWRAQICTNGRNKHLGSFDTPEEAHEVYLTAKRKLHEGCTI